MNKRLLLPVFFLITLLSSCEVIGGIFKAGFYTAIFVVIAIIAVIIFIARFFRRS